jgi:hypothetical protein
MSIVKYCAWSVAALVLLTGVTAGVAPDFVLSLRSLVASQLGLLIIAVLRVAIGIVMIMAAPTSRAPRALQAAGAIVMLAGMATPLFGVERTRAVLAWEAAQGPALIRMVGAVVLMIGGFLTFALMPRRA